MHILVLAMLCSLSLLSCGKLIYEEGNDCDESVMHVSLRVSAGGSAMSRAFTETEEPGTGYENFIDVNKLHILFFDTDNTFLQSFEPEKSTLRTIVNILRHGNLGEQSRTRPRQVSRLWLWPTGRLIQTGSRPE